MNDKISLQKENGQAMVIMAFALIVLLGMLALSIDGGRAFTERRKAQNAADASTIAAARELGSGASSVTAKRIAYETALANGYNLVESNIQIYDVAATGYDTSLTSSYVVSITVDSGIEASFAQFVYDDFLDVNAYSQMEVNLSHAPMGGFGVVSLGSGCGSSAPGVGVAGGGTSGGVRTYGSTMIINVSGANDCAFDPPNNGNGIFAFDDDGNPLPLYTVGDYTCTPVGSETCLNQMGTVETNYNGGVPFPDPLANLPAPTCLSNGTSSGSGADTIYTPGNWDSQDLKEGTYQPGIYCISDPLHNMKITSGNVYAQGALFYFIDTGMEFTGGGNLYLEAPNSSNCTGEYEGILDGMTTSASCNYQNLAIYMQRGNDSDIIVSGNGTNRIIGTIYGADATFIGSGGGSAADEGLVWGQILMSSVQGGGNGSLDVWYREDLIYILPPYISALN